MMTLNMHMSIQAAANPLYGCYNPKVSPVEAINLPAAMLVCHFDLPLCDNDGNE